MKIFRSLELSKNNTDEEKERKIIEIFEQLTTETEKFCLVNRTRLHCINGAIYELIYNTFHGVSEVEGSLKIEMGLNRCDKKLVFFIRDNGNFYKRKKVRKLIKEKNLDKLRNFKPHKKSNGWGFKIIFESKPKISIVKGTLYFIWEKAYD